MKERVYPFVVPILLIVIALNQQFLAHVRQMTPWKGGGFGMFSSVDTRSARFLRCFVTIDGVERPVPLPRRLSNQYSYIRSLPTEARLTRLFEDFRKFEWYEWMSREENEEPSPEPELVDHNAAPDDATAGISSEEMKDGPPIDPLKMDASEDGMAEEVNSAPPLSESELPPEPKQRRVTSFMPFEVAAMPEKIRTRFRKLEPEAIRFELWRYGFEMESHRISAKITWEKNEVLTP
ncbi:MAG: hypothetical protein AAF492_17755 [Verrucomicrobiota bacterium]